jgi:hypothetical protein
MQLGQQQHTRYHDARTDICDVLGFCLWDDGRVTVGRAIGKTRQLIVGRGNLSPDPPEKMIAAVYKAGDLLAEKNIAGAILEIMQLRLFGVSFASKIIAFLSPEHAGVYDAVIAGKLEKSEEELQTLHFSPAHCSSETARDRQAQGYARWCRWCSSAAHD